MTTRRMTGYGLLLEVAQATSRLLTLAAARKLDAAMVLENNAHILATTRLTRRGVEMVCDQSERATRALMIGAKEISND